MGHLFMPIMMLAVARHFGPQAETMTRMWIYFVYGFSPPTQETPEYGK